MAATTAITLKADIKIDLFVGLSNGVVPISTKMITESIKRASIKSVLIFRSRNF